jgi:hypothetical protein
MKTHYLKTWPEYFQAIKSGEKKAELRLNDRDFKVGDELVLQEYDPGGTEHFYDPSDYHGAGERQHAPRYTGESLNVFVTHILIYNDGFGGLSRDWVMMSIEPDDLPF